MVFQGRFTGLKLYGRERTCFPAVVTFKSIYINLLTSPWWDDDTVQILTFGTRSSIAGVLQTIVLWRALRDRRMKKYLTDIRTDDPAALEDHTKNNWWMFPSTNKQLLKMVIYSWFTHWKWWSSIVMLVYQRVYTSYISDIRDKPGWGNFLTAVASY